MPDIEKGNKKSVQDKAPVPFRISPETAEKFRNVSKEFANQDSALNGLMAALERERLQQQNPQFVEDMAKFESYQRFLSTKYTETLNALATAEERAKGEVQKLLDSKDSIILQLQNTVDQTKESKARYEEFYRTVQEENKTLKETIDHERLEIEGLQKKMQEKEEQHASIVADKERLNDILSKNVEESQQKLKVYEDYPQRMGQLEEKIRMMEEQIQELESQNKEAEYKYRMGLLEAEKEHERVRAAEKADYDVRMAELRDKFEKEKDRLREKIEESQEKIQNLMEEYSRRNE